MKQLKAGTILNYLFVSLIAFVTLYPFIYILSTSITPAAELLKGRVLFLPKGFDLTAYRLVFQDSRIPLGFRNTLFYTLCGTALSIVMTTITAYPLAQPDFARYSKIYMKFVVFTMLFSGGLIPTYLAIRSYELINTPWIMVFAGIGYYIISPFYLILTRTFMREIPRAIYESAMIEGASDLKTLTYIVIPLSMPIIACITLYYAVGIWNNYTTPLIFLSSKELFPMQIFLRQIVLQSDMQDQMVSGGALFNSEAVKSATLVVSTVPILMAYPFLQKYFIKGIMVGAVKG